MSETDLKKSPPTIPKRPSRKASVASGNSFEEHSIETSNTPKEEIHESVDNLKQDETEQLKIDIIEYSQISNDDILHKVNESVIKGAQKDPTDNLSEDIDKQKEVSEIRNNINQKVFTDPVSKIETNSEVEKKKGAEISDTFIDEENIQKNIIDDSEIRPSVPRRPSKLSSSGSESSVPIIPRRPTSEGDESPKATIKKRQSFDTNGSSTSTVSEGLDRPKSKPVIANKLRSEKLAPPKPTIPHRPSKADAPSSEIKKREPPPTVPKKPSSKILAFQTMLAQQQEQQSRFTPKPPVRKLTSDSINSSSSEEDNKPNKRAEFAKNLNGIFGVALPGMTPPGFTGRPNKTSSNDEEDSKDDNTGYGSEHKEKSEEEVKKPSTKRGRISVRGRRLPSATTKKVDTTIQTKKYSIYVTNIWELDV